MEQEEKEVIRIYDRHVATIHPYLLPIALVKHFAMWMARAHANEWVAIAGAIGRGQTAM